MVILRRFNSTLLMLLLSGAALALPDVDADRGSQQSIGARSRGKRASNRAEPGDKSSRQRPGDHDDTREIILKEPGP
jgi:hypothetical protein